MRTHWANSDAPIVLKDVTEKITDGRGSYKPAGFWYEVEGDWRRWCEENEFGRGDYLFQVDVRCEVLQLDTVRELDRFHREYSIREKVTESYSWTQIDWARVAERYDGLEIAPYRWERRMVDDFMWYYGWDCASGVIWRPKDTAVTYLGHYPAKPKEEVLYDESVGEG